MLKRKTISLILLWFAVIQHGFAQTDTTSLIDLYDRVLDFDETKQDSVIHYADFIEEHSQKLQFARGRVLSLRLHGIYKEFKNDYYSAIDYYYQCLEEARRLKRQDYEAAALGDLAIVYNTINQPEKTRDLYKEALRIALVRKEASSIFTNSTNLGSVYNKLEMPDSALVYLRQAEELAEKFPGKFDLGSLHNNIGNAWFYKKDWDKALSFFTVNYEKDVRKNDQEMLWYDCLNIADVYTEKQQFDSAGKYLVRAEEIALILGSERKKADVYALYSKYFARRNEYKSAYEYFNKWYRIDTALISTHTMQSVASLQERYHLKQKELENKELELEIDRQKLHKRNLMLVTVVAGLLAVSAVVILLLIRNKNQQLNRQNKLIQKQNNKLAQFNVEKNSLISVVSHDLSGPFTSIKMWSQLLHQSGISNLNEDQKKALYRIQSSADNGEMLIRNMLYIEKEEISGHSLSLEQLEMNAFLEDVIQIYHQQARQKEITIDYESPGKPVSVMSDRYMLNRICENLLSNAIKFTHRGKRVWAILTEDADSVTLKIKDEGVGIAPEDIPYLFSKYRKISSMPTEGEYSTGLGLSIVKRLIEELNGKITCESEPGKGSVFIVHLRK
ncbi:MAG: tetratricopeptide repeat-containing sensor histidine kinase [Chitinophagaceae bacterium]|nr:tetratricopeptide repeat-containing sensor histidine kinase [Chitinophagaceae bacterium]